MSLTEAAESQRLDGEIIPPALAVKAMRDSGYKNTAYALAELIDNSVQANASNVEVICLEAYRQVNERASRRIQAIGILDNRSEEHKSELQSLMRISYAVSCLNTNKTIQ